MCIRDRQYLMPSAFSPLWSTISLPVMRRLQRLEPCARLGLPAEREAYLIWRTGQYEHGVLVHCTKKGVLIGPCLSGVRDRSRKAETRSGSVHESPALR